MIQASGDPPLLENRNEIKEQINVNLTRSSILHSRKVQEKAAGNRESVGTHQNSGNSFT